jgi:hypothetical protein
MPVRRGRTYLAPAPTAFRPRPQRQCNPTHDNHGLQGSIMVVGLNAARSGPYREEVRSKTRAIPADGGNVPALLKGSV